ncbi:DUF3313 family protein [Maricaulis alexandrii]|uniref:DUF3313 family protein n=1 Tax=Maricaulis alexandrii TaxID=2570354 RepID=UPI00110889D0|nr:DUF3313 family protein [Maricaulis alexandrii]
MRFSIICLPAIVAGCLLAGCSTRFETPTELTSTERLVSGERRLVPVLEYADGEALAGIDTLHVPVVELSAGAEFDDALTPDRLDYLRAVVSREICQRFARGGFSILPTPEDADAVARLEARITGLRRSNVATTGLSRAIGVAVPGPLNPRVPIGIGALGAEGEILTPDGEQIAAIQWASQNHLASGGGITTLLDGPDAFGDLADATELASVFADAFGDLVVEARGDFDAVEGDTPLGTCDAYVEAYRDETD